MALTKVQAGLLEATGTADSTTFLRGDGAWSAPAALSTASGSAPSYSARAWVNFNGTGTVAIRASGNVSSITDNSVGNYTVNFATAMPDANYSYCGSHSSGSGGVSSFILNNVGVTAPTTTAAVVGCFISGAGADPLYVNIAFFR
jgi:hypothetical protein